MASYGLRSADISEVLLFSLLLDSFLSRPQVVILEMSDDVDIEISIRLSGSIYYILGGGFKYCLFSLLLGEMIHLTNIFQMGWNHQPVILVGAVRNEHKKLHTMTGHEFW